jgi:hypothetical protein
VWYFFINIHNGARRPIYAYDKGNISRKKQENTNKKIPHSQNNGQIVEAGVYIFTFVISVP